MFWSERYSLGSKSLLVIRKSILTVKGGKMPKLHVIRINVSNGVHIRHLSVNPWSQDISKRKVNMNRPKKLQWECSDQFEITLDHPEHFGNQENPIPSQEIGNQWVASTNDVLDDAPENYLPPDFPHGYRV